MTIEQRIADAVFDLIEMHSLARKPLLKTDVEERVRGVMASEKAKWQSIYDAHKANAIVNVSPGRLIASNETPVFMYYYDMPT